MGSLRCRLAGFDRLSPQLGRSGLPQGFALGANYPNPFNPATVIPYQLAASAQVRLEVFNLLGQRLATLVDGYQAAGAHTAMWTATNAAGQAVSAGVYLYRMTVDGQQQTGRMVLVDGQAGVAAAVGPGRQTVVGATDAGERSYGLAVLGAGVVPYVDADFRVDAGPVAVVVEPGALQPRGKGLATADDELDALFALLNSFATEIESQNEGDDTETAEADTSAVGLADLVADSLWVDRSDVMPGRSFALNVRIQNQGTGPTDSTMVRFYLSNNAKISPEDRLIASAPVGGLAAKDTSTVAIELTAPLQENTYLYGACVDVVAGGEIYETNNCSDAVRVTVAHRADLVVSAAVSSGVASQGNNIFPLAQSFTLLATVSNQGTGASDSTIVYYYSSADATIGADDTELGTAAVDSLGAADTSQHSLRCLRRRKSARITMVRVWPVSKASARRTTIVPMECA